MFSLCRREAWKQGNRLLRKRLLALQELEATQAVPHPRGATVYVDEGIINRDVLPGKSWFLKERPDQVDSTFPGKKILFYAV